MQQSVLITPKLCERLGAKDTWISFMKDHHPGGFTFDDVYTRKLRHLPYGFIHFMYNKLPMTSEDKAKYIELCKIVNSTGFYSCYDINGCRNIADSKFCLNSSSVFDSSHVELSDHIFKSKEITNSQKVFNSERVDKSTNVLNSWGIDECHDVVESSNVTASSNIAYCKAIISSHFLLECEDTITSFMSKGLKNCSDKIFCYDLSDDPNPRIFNRLVSKKRFNATYAMLLEFMQDIKMDFILPPEGEQGIIPALPQARPAISIFYNTFKRLPAFWSEIKDLLDVTDDDKELLYQITFAEGVFE